MPNCLDYVHVLFGCALVGVRALLVNARYKEHELRTSSATPAPSRS